MAFSIDDGWDNCGPVARAGNAAFGVYCRCGAWAARNSTDGHVPAEVALAYGSPELAKRLVDVGLWEAVGGGWSMPHYLERNPSAEVVRQRKAQVAKRNALSRDPELRTMIRIRDGDRCRYCGIKVVWSDRKGSSGGTYDHVDTCGPNTLENLVVCCRRCNLVKGDRTLEVAGMTLLPPPIQSPTQIRSESDQARTTSRTRAFTPPKGGKAARASDALPKPHPYDDDGHGNCRHCPLPKINVKVHRAA